MKAIGKCKNNLIFFPQKYILNHLHLLSLGLQLIMASAIIKQFLPHCSALLLVLAVSLRKPCRNTAHVQCTDKEMTQCFCWISSSVTFITHPCCYWATQSTVSFRNLSIVRIQKYSVLQLRSAGQHLYKREGSNLTPKNSCCRCYFTKL